MPIFRVIADDRTVCILADYFGVFHYDFIFAKEVLILANLFRFKRLKVLSRVPCTSIAFLLRPIDGAFSLLLNLTEIYIRYCIPVVLLRK